MDSRRIKKLKRKASFMICVNTPEEMYDFNTSDDDENGWISINNRKAGIVRRKAIDSFGMERDRAFESIKRQVSDDFYSIPLNKCRSCKGHLEKYSEIYIKREYFGAHWYRTLYCFENGYCEKCAKDKAALTPITMNPYVVDEYQYQLIGDNYATTVQVFSDGSVEESNDEWAQKRQ